MAIIRIAPGEVAVGNTDDELRTLLGSCVAITLWDPQRRVGAMCHVTLPSHPGIRRIDAPDTRYAEGAWAAMRKGLVKHGIDPAACACKLFGGAQVYRHARAVVGQRNLEAVAELLATEDVRVTSQHVAGTGYRELRFVIASGDVWVRHRTGLVDLGLIGETQ